jgi:hypothetical protein
VRAFVGSPSSLQTLDAGCASEPPIHAVGVYASNLAEEPPAVAAEGTPDAEVLKLVAAAVQTAGDGVTRLANIGGRRDFGLGGGSVVEAAEENEDLFKADELIPGVPVSGAVKLRPEHTEADGELAVAKLSFSGDGLNGTLSARWTTAGTAQDLAQIRAKVDGERFTATVPAP